MVARAQLLDDLDDGDQLTERPTTKRSKPRGAKKKKATKKLRPTKCTDELIRRFCKLILKGASPDLACDYLGISTHSFWLWLRRGENYVAGNGEESEAAQDKQYAKFVTAFKKANAKYRMRRITSMHDRQNTQWWRDMAILERRDRRSWGRKPIEGGTIEDYDPDDKFL